MFANAVAELEVLVEHCAERERDGLRNVRIVNFGGDSSPTLRNMYEVGGGTGALGEGPENCWVSRSSKRMPPYLY